MTLVVFGRTGQVATELSRLNDVRVVGRDEADLSDLEALSAFAKNVSATAFVNAAAYTDVDGAETDEALATRINGHAPGLLAKVAAERGVPFVHLSTDYVFDGSGSAPWQPHDTPRPLSAYGRGKLAGENAVQAAGGAYAILRTSWIFSAHGRNFVKTMLRLAQDRSRLDVVDDQVGGPTPARDMAAACLKIVAGLSADKDRSGTYHFSGAPDLSWADFATAIFAAARCEVDVVRVPTTAFPRPAVRPLNSRLDCAATEATFGVAQPDWHAGLLQVLSELAESRAA